MDLKLTTLNRMMKVLEERKPIFPSGKVESTGGRKATTYDVVHQGFYLIGVDLSMTYNQLYTFFGFSPRLVGDDEKQRRADDLFCLLHDNKEPYRTIL